MSDPEGEGIDFSNHFANRGAAIPAQRTLSRIHAAEIAGKLGSGKHRLKIVKQSAQAAPQQSKAGKRKHADTLLFTDSNAQRKKPKAVSAGDHNGRTQTKERVTKDFWPFEVDYNDHFESPLEAVQDIEPVLQLLCKKLKKPKSSLIIYDPFFCKGGIRRHYEQLGFKNFIHRNQDFYADVDSENLPAYDILVTNPPYSTDHKERVLEFCLRSGKAWALLLPNYVATKAYFGQLLESTSTPASQRPFFLTPAIRYSYDHPEGTGHSEPPFFSIWYVGLGEHTEAVYGACRARLAEPPAASPAAGAKRKGSGGGDCGGREAAVGSAREGVWAVSLARSVDALRQAGAVPTARRLNPKQRARLKQQQLQAAQ